MLKGQQIILTLKYFYVYIFVYSNMIIRCYRLNARPHFILFIYFYYYYYFLFYFFFFGGGGSKESENCICICIMDMHNLQQLWISIIALWVNMFTRLWISIFSVMAVHYDYP